MEESKDSKRVTGVIEIDFDAINLSKDKIGVFEKAIDNWIGNDLDIVLYDMAEKSGFEIISMHPLRLDSLETTNYNA